MSPVSVSAHMDGSSAIVDLPHLKLTFQHGPPIEAGVNGCSLEDVIDVLVEKLLDFQGRSLACPENDTAIHHLQQAKVALTARIRAREQQGVRGTLAPHKPV